MLKRFGNRLLMLRIRRDEKEIKVGFLITGFIIIILFSYLIYLNFQFVKSKDSAAMTGPIEPREEETIPTTTVVTTTTIITTDTLPTVNPVQNITTQTKTSFKDYYINLGSGTNKSTDWEDVSGTFSTFDIAAYKNIQEVRLETTTNVSTANGTISVRLFNKTNGYAVWNSERTVQAETQGTLLISEKINYDYGPKLYSVQMKSQLGVKADLIQARIHIVAE